MKRRWLVLGGSLALVTAAQWLRSANGEFRLPANDSPLVTPAAHADEARTAFNEAAALYRARRYEDADVRFGTAAHKGDSLLAARSAYDRGNCDLSEACAGGKQPNAQLLDQAIEQYRECLNHESEGLDAGTLFDDARHNLELAKLLRHRDGGSQDRNESHPPHADADHQTAKSDPADASQGPEHHEHKTPEEKEKCPT